MDHQLKTWTEPFSAVVAGQKTFEVRRDDRGYRAGDRLVLREWDPIAGRYSGRRCVVEVAYVLPGGQFGIEHGYVAMSIRADH